jgi:hypothetical protein
VRNREREGEFIFLKGKEKKQLEWRRNRQNMGEEE